jgi:signal transduction histidine kinase
MSARQIDAALATVVVVATALEVAVADATMAERAAAVLPAALAAAALLVRRREPLGGLLLAVLAVASTGLLAHEVWDALNTIYVVLLFLTYSMAGLESGRRLIAGIVIAVAGVLVISLALPDREGELAATTLIGLAFFVVAPVVAGRLLHSRLELSAALAEKAARLDTARETRSREAANAERTRIAGELHDIVAHALGAMTVQAAAARRLAASDATRAAGAFEAIETTGRDALGELRTLLDALRDDSEPDALHAPTPTLAELAELAARARTAGLNVTLDVEGDRPEVLPKGIDVTAYRVIQEALRGALSNGGAGSATVHVRYRAGRLDVEVIDDGVHVDDRRLLGLRERVHLYGGEVEAGVESAGVHAVRAWLPLEGVAA